MTIFQANSRSKYTPSYLHPIFLIRSNGNPQTIYRPMPYPTLASLHYSLIQPYRIFQSAIHIQSQKVCTITHHANRAKEKDTAFSLVCFSRFW